MKTTPAKEIREKIPVVMRNNKRKPPGGVQKGKQNGLVKTFKRLFNGKKQRPFGKDKVASNECFSYDWCSNPQQRNWRTNDGSGFENNSGKLDANGGGNNAILGNRNRFGNNVERFNPSLNGFGSIADPFMTSQNGWENNNTDFFLANQNGYVNNAEPFMINQNGWETNTESFLGNQDRFGNNPEVCFTNQNGFQNNSYLFRINQNGFQNYSDPVTLNQNGFQNYSDPVTLNQNGFQNYSDPVTINQNGWMNNQNELGTPSNFFKIHSRFGNGPGVDNWSGRQPLPVKTQLINFNEPEVLDIPIPQLSSNVLVEAGSGRFDGQHSNMLQPNWDNTFFPNFEQCFPPKNQCQVYPDGVWERPPAILQNVPPPQPFPNFQCTLPYGINPNLQWNSPNDNRKRLLVVTKRAQTILKSISPRFTNPFLKSGLFGASVLSSASPMYDHILTYVRNGQCYEKFGLMPVNVVKIIRPNQNFGVEESNIASHTQMLFHGTHYENIPSILEYGLQCPREWNVGQRFGKGVYFSDRIGKCAHFTFGDRPQPGQTHFIILCEVQLGRVYTAVTGEGSQYHTAPPELANEYGEIVKYDSVKCTGREIPDPKEDLTFGNVIWPLGPTIENPNITRYMVKVNEFVVYNPAQINIRYIVEVKITEEHTSKQSS